MIRNFNLQMMYNTFNEQHFNFRLPDLGENVTVKWNHRAVRRAGQIAYVKSRDSWRPSIIGGHINLSAKVFAANDWDREKVERTLIHEMVHLWCALRHNETGHGAHFQRKMREITGENKNHRCHDYKTPTQGAKFVGTCGCSTYYRQRTSKHIRAGARFTCRKCNGKFQYKPIR